MVIFCIFPGVLIFALFEYTETIVLQSCRDGGERAMLVLTGADQTRNTERWRGESDAGADRG